MSNTNQPRGTPANKMLIDATHPEETRVVVLRNGRVEEFDYESAARKLLRGNIYLAKVTRVEPSLQAGFVEYGGNRHGFLAFSEIHPDYYQIPVADRRALLEAEAEAEAEEEAAADRAADAAAARRSRRQEGRQGSNRDIDAESNLDASSDGYRDADEDNAVDVTELLPPETVGGEDRRDEDRRDDLGDVPVYAEPDSEPKRTMATTAESDPSISEPAPFDQHPRDHELAHDDDGGRRSEPEGGDESRVESVDHGNGNGTEASEVETVASDEDALEEMPVRPRRRMRSYKIQEVIKRRQVILVQVVKEERGTKGAALTTYLSLAGRYTVLMPNTARGGGISRKITNAQDRKRLKAIANELEVPEGMGLIIRTAGAARTKQEIKRDYDYLLRLWESVRDLAISSNAPALVYEEGNLIKRSIRDLYGKEVDEIVVAGAVAHTEAHDFMRMLMPSHVKNVIAYNDPEPLFSRYQIERQLNAMFSPFVHLRSGGYLVINQTEALVAIDINSGKSTREFSIEETALSTNMEAADEIARQLKLRDLAGLIVIDFIDMEEKRNNRKVENRMKDALRHDRARIQVGRISHFGLLEMSRQRMRTGVLEGSTTQCPHCQGTGIIRSTESVALGVLRGLEDSLMTGTPSSMIVSTTSTVALYILNHKRSFIIEMEARYGIVIQIIGSDKVQGANFAIERLARAVEPQRRPERTAVNMDWGFDDEDAEEPAADNDEERPRSGGSSAGGASAGGSSGHRDRDRDRDSDRDGASRSARDVGRDGGRDGGRDEENGEGGDPRRKRRRRRRGGRRDEPGDMRADRGGEGRQDNDNTSDDDDQISEIGGGERDVEVSGGDRDGNREGSRESSGGRERNGGRDRDRGRGRDRNRDRGQDRGPRPARLDDAPAGRQDVTAGDESDSTGTESVDQGDSGRGEASRAEPSRGDTGSGEEGRGRRGRRRGRRGGRRGQERDRPDQAATLVGADDGTDEDRASDGAALSDEVAADQSFFDDRDNAPRAEPVEIREHRPVHSEPVVEHVAAIERAHEPAQAPVPVIERVPYVEAAPTVVPAPAVAEVVAPVPVMAPRPSARTAPVASEPVLERLVVGPDAAQAVAEEPKPAKRGWWNRK